MKRLISNANPKTPVVVRINNRDTVYSREKNRYTRINVIHNK